MRVTWLIVGSMIGAPALAQSVDPFALGWSFDAAIYSGTGIAGTTLGADVNSAAENGDTPLIRALRRLRSAGQGEVVGLLLEQGADVNRKGSGGTTPLMVAVGQDAVVVEM